MEPRPADAESSKQMKPIRVVHVLHTFGFGGLEKGIATVIGNASQDFEHIVVCLSKTGESASLLPKETRVLELQKQEGSSLRFILRLSRRLKALKPDVVHTRNWGGMDGIVASLLVGLRRRVVQGEHGWGMEDAYGSNPKRIWTRRILSLAVAEFTCVSEQMKGWLEDRVRVRAPVTQIYNGIDTSRFSPRGPGASLRQELGISESTQIIAAVGRLDPIKDHLRLIQAFGEVQKTNPDCALVIVGDGPEQERLAAMGPSRVYLLGARNDVPEILRDVDIFALASINEGISNTILESMAAGLPVVSTRVGGTPELIEHEVNGLLAEPRDANTLASHLLTYLNSHELRTEHGQRNRRLAKERFSIGAMVAGYEQVWRRVANLTLRV